MSEEIIILSEDAAQRGVLTENLTRAEFDAWALNWAMGSVTAPAPVLEELIDRFGFAEIHRAFTLLSPLELPLVDAAFPIQAFSQNDPIRRGKLLGKGPATIGGAGCALNCCAMLASRADANITPLLLNGELNAHAGFVYVNGFPNVRWSVVAEIVLGLEYTGRHDWDSAVSVDNLAFLRQQIETYGPQIIEVDFKPETSEQQQHFVVGTAWLETEDELTGEIRHDIAIIDPYRIGDAMHTTLLTHYGGEQGHDLARAVWGWRGYRVS